MLMPSWSSAPSQPGKSQQKTLTSSDPVSGEQIRLKALEDENAKLKRILADTMLDNVALKDLLGKKW